MAFMVLIGRLFYSAIFVVSGLNHLSGGVTDYAAAAGVSAPLVYLSGALSLFGGVSVALGWRARLGAWALILFLVPVTFTMHRFWGLSDPQAAMMQQVQFMKNLSLLGGALLTSYFGPGPLSMDARRALRLPRWRPARRPIGV